MVKDMAETAEEMVRATGAEDVSVSKDYFLEGASIHELGTARMGNDPKTSVTNGFGQTHDVKNLFVLDGSIFASRRLSEPDLDDPRARTARVGISCGAIENRRGLEGIPTVPSAKC